MRRRPGSLCSLDIHVPTQLLAAPVWDMHAYVWFPPQEERFLVAGSLVTLRFGFHSADLIVRVRCKAGEARLSAHKESEFESLRSTLHEERTQTRSGGIGLKASLNLPTLLGGSVGGERTGAQAAVATTDVTNVVKRYTLESIDRDTWRMHGLGHCDGILSGRVVNEEPLCQLEHKGEGHSMEAFVSARATSLYVGVVDGEGNASTQGTAANRTAVVGAIIAQSYKKKHNGSREEVDVFTLARQRSKLIPPPVTE